MKRNLFIFMFIFILLSTLTSCGGINSPAPWSAPTPTPTLIPGSNPTPTPTPGSAPTPTPGSSGLKISVSFVGKAGFNPQSFKAAAINPIIDETYFKTELKSGARGTLVTCNPVIRNFIADISTIKVYTASSAKPLLAVTGTEGSTGYTIPQHYDLIYAKNIIREFSLNQSSWDGFYMSFLPFCGQSNYDAGPFNMLSIIAVDLGAQYASVTLPNEITQIQDYTNGGISIPLPARPNIHYFTLASLQPYACYYLGYLITGGDIGADGIQNPEGANASWDIRGGDKTNGNSTQLFLKGTYLNFSGKTKPALVFYWDMSNLIEVYDKGTPGVKTDDIVTFRLADPFPVSIEVVEESQVTPPTNTALSLEEVQLPFITGKIYNVLQWINPNYPDFEKTVIVRKAGSAPTSNDDGEIVYEGYTPNYCDHTGIKGTRYYYRIYTVDTLGGQSNGIVLDHVQP